MGFPISLAMDSGAAAESAAAEIGAAAESSSQGRIQDLVLPLPTDTTTGTTNYEQLRERWLEGCYEEEELPPPDDLEDHVDFLILSDKPKYGDEAVPLSCLIDALADQWMTDNTL